jgi:hypothetical protein
VTREQAASVLSATAPIILNRFDGGKTLPESDAAPAGSLDSLLDGTGQQMNVRIQGELGFTPEQAAKVIPLLVPIVLRFLTLPAGSPGGTFIGEDGPLPW